ncbi:MAG: TRAP transporter small permease [Sulfuritalea sp.]|nr:TRAP transporter small permease [Sulfuritalea sp.]
MTAATPTGGGPLQLLDRLSFYVNEGLAWAAAFILAAMMLFAVADMVLRGFGITVAGSYEVVGWLSAAAMALALGTVQRHRGHVAMELMVVKLGQRSRAIVEALMALMALLLFAAVAWYVARYGRVLHETGSLSETLRVIVYPWVYLVAAGCLGLTLALLVDFLRAAAQLFAASRH